MLSSYFSFTELPLYTHLLLAIVCLVILYVISKLTVLVIGLKSERKVDIADKPGVSVILTVRNSASLLEKNIPIYFNQNYPYFEVIVVDECSDDETQDVLERLQLKYPLLKVTKLPNGTKFRATKKIAINLGVLAASYDILLFSEIAATPKTPNWIAEMVSYYDEDTVSVVGYSNFNRNKKRFIEFSYLLGVLDYWFVRLQIRNHHFHIGNGYNMSYRKSAYLKARGFTYNTQRYMGYDSDIVQLVSQYGKVKTVATPDSFLEIERGADRDYQDLFLYRIALICRLPFLLFLRSNFLSLLRTIIVLLIVFLFSNLVYINEILTLLGVLLLIDATNLLIILSHFKQTKLTISTFMLCFIGWFYQFYLFSKSLIIAKKWS